MKRKQKSLSKPPQNIVGTHIHAQTPPTHMFLYILNVYTFVHLHHRLHAPTHVSRMGLQCIDANNDACIFSCALTCTHSLARGQGYVFSYCFRFRSSLLLSLPPSLVSFSLPPSSVSPPSIVSFPLSHSSPSSPSLFLLLSRRFLAVFYVNV